MFESGWHQHITDVWGSQLGQKYGEHDVLGNALVPLIKRQGAQQKFLQDQGKKVCQP